MKDLLNIIAALCVCVCVHACKTHMYTHTEEETSIRDSFDELKSVQAYSDIDLWNASSLLSDAKVGAWTKIRIYDTNKPDNPLIMDIEKRDSSHTNIVFQVNDSANIDISSDVKDSITNDINIDHGKYNEHETIAEERVSEMWRNMAKFGFCLLLLYGLYVLSKKFQ